MEGKSFDFRRLLLSECKCVEIMQADQTRHFRGCPLREKYPTHDAETSNTPPDAVEHKMSTDEVERVLAVGPEVKAAFLAEKLESHQKQMDHLLEKSGVPAVIYLAGAVKDLLAVAHRPDEPTLEERVRMLEQDAMKLAGAATSDMGRIKELEAKMGLICSASFFDRIKKLEERVEELDDTLSHDFGALRDRGDVHDDRLNRLELFVPPGNAKHLDTRVDAVEKAVILHEKRIEKLEKEQVTFLFPYRDAVRSSGNVGPVDPNILDKMMQHTSRPKIVCLCGSTRFMSAFHKAQLDETLKGNIVLTVGNTYESDRELCLQPDTKKMLDELHKKKIDMADEVFVLNIVACKYCKRSRSDHMAAPGGWACGQSSSPVPDDEMRSYIGESTRSEIAHALLHGKPVRFLNDQLIDETFWKSIQLAEPSGYPRKMKMVPGDTLTYRGHRGGG